MLAFNFKSIFMYSFNWGKCINVPMLTGYSILNKYNINNLKNNYLVFTS